MSDQAGYYWVLRPGIEKPLPAELDDRGRFWFFGCDVPYYELEIVGSIGLPPFIKRE